MTTTRKTIKVDELKKRANHVLLNSADDAQNVRQGWINMIEGVLMDTGNYRGFGYLNNRHMRESTGGVSVGINDHNLPHDKRYEGTDPTRVMYY